MALDLLRGRALWLGFGISVACGGNRSVAVPADRIPYPQALAAARIQVPGLDDLLEHALLIGNGDINALVSSQGANLLLTLTKNDVWDARLDTSNDPPLPTLKRIKELTMGNWPDRNVVLPEGLEWKGPDSYGHAYPCPRACARVRLGRKPTGPIWEQIRAQGSHNAWETRGNVTVMSIEGRKDDSNGYAFGPLDFSTDDYSTLRLKLSGSENARFYFDLMGPGQTGISGSGWKETPTQTEERTFNLPPGRKATTLILYTWTEDGKRAENRFESVAFEGKAGTLAVDLHVIVPPSCEATLDIHHAVARVAGAAAGVPKAEVRAIAEGNVFLVESEADAELLPIESGGIPPVTRGERDGVAWLQQAIPGDPDWPGMSFAVALAVNGGRKAVAIVTSRESKDPTADAVALARSTAQADPAELTRRHEAEWQRFWSASGIEVEEALLRDTWYRNLYFLRCVTKPGVVSPGLFASLISDAPAWHGDYHTNYNIQQTFWGTYITNHPDLSQPYDQFVSAYLPRARWLARQAFDCGGAYYPHVMYAYEPPNPETCKSRNGRQYIHHVWGFTIGVSGFTVQPLWWHYKYEPNREFLDTVAYPAVRDVAAFYADFVDRCEAETAAAQPGAAVPQGKVVLGPSVSPEHWGWTPKFERNRNCTFDIGMARFTLAAAIEGATALGRDADLVARFQKTLQRLPDYPTTNTEPPVVVDVLGAPPTCYNIAVPATPVFPSDVVTWLSPAQERELFTRTIQGLQWNGNNSAVMLGVARARLSMDGTLEWLREEVQTRLRPNGTLTLNRLGAQFNAFGHYTEQFGITMAISELLMQSVGDVIRLFPAWPKGKAARFEKLRAQGGFLVSASLAGGTVEQVAIASTVGGKLQLQNPWPTIHVRRGNADAGAALSSDARGIVELETRPGETLFFGP